jgi:hypothetical protein
MRLGHANLAFYGGSVDAVLLVWVAQWLMDLIHYYFSKNYTLATFTHYCAMGIVYYNSHWPLQLKQAGPGDLAWVLRYFFPGIDRSPKQRTAVFGVGSDCRFPLFSLCAGCRGNLSILSIWIDQCSFPLWKRFSLPLGFCLICYCYKCCVILSTKRKWGMPLPCTVNILVELEWRNKYSMDPGRRTFKDHIKIFMT